MQAISLEDLLSQSETAQHSAIVALYRRVDVHYLVVFTDDTESNRGLVAVGPGHDFKSIEEIREADFDGLRPRTYVPSQTIAQRSKKLPVNSVAKTVPTVKLDEEVISASSLHPITEKISPPSAPSAPTSNHPTLPLSPEVAALLEDNPTLQTLREHLEGELSKIQVQQTAFDKLRKELQEREKWLGETEDRLSRLADDFMERETNLQKRELALQKRESAFYALRFDTAQSKGASKQLLEA